MKPLCRVYIFPVGKEVNELTLKTVLLLITSRTSGKRGYNYIKYPMVISQI